MNPDELDGSGGWISKHLDDVSDALSQFEPEDDDILRLTESVLQGIELLRNNSKLDDKFDSDSSWAYNAFVRRYFESGIQ